MNERLQSKNLDDILKELEIFKGLINDEDIKKLEKLINEFKERYRGKNLEEKNREMIYGLYHLLYYSDSIELRKYVFDKFFEFSHRYGLEESISFLDSLNSLYYDFESSLAIKEILDNINIEDLEGIKEFKGEYYRRTLSNILRISYYIKDKSIIKNIIGFLMGFNERDAAVVIDYIKDFVILMHMTNDKNKKEKIEFLLSRSIDIVPYIIKYLSPLGFLEAINKGYSNYINKKERIEAISLYLKYGEKEVLPPITENNIDRYIEDINKILERKYGISKKLNIDELLFFFELDEDKRKEISKIINNSKEYYKKIHEVYDLDKTKVMFEGREIISDNPRYLIVEINKNPLDYDSRILGEEFLPNGSDYENGILAWINKENFYPMLYKLGNSVIGSLLLYVDNINKIMIVDKYFGYLDKNIFRYLVYDIREFARDLKMKYIVYNNGFEEFLGKENKEYLYKYFPNKIPSKGRIKINKNDDLKYLNTKIYEDGYIEGYIESF